MNLLPVCMNPRLTYASSKRLSSPRTTLTLPSEATNHTAMTGKMLNLVASSHMSNRMSTSKRSESELRRQLRSYFVRTDKSTWINLNNVYIPPQKSTCQEIDFCPEIIPAPANSIICGDFNAHSRIWDNIQPEENRGHRVEDWIAENELVLLNTGAVTHINRATVVVALQI